jgi:hypothetical protein
MEIRQKRAGRIIPRCAKSWFPAAPGVPRPAAFAGRGGHTLLTRWGTEMWQSSMRPIGAQKQIPHFVRNDNCVGLPFRAEGQESASGFLHNLLSGIDRRTKYSSSDLYFQTLT